MHIHQESIIKVNMKATKTLTIKLYLELQPNYFKNPFNTPSNHSTTYLHR